MGGGKGKGKETAVETYAMGAIDKGGEHSSMNVDSNPKVTTVKDAARIEQSPKLGVISRLLRGRRGGGKGKEREAVSRRHGVGMAGKDFLMSDVNSGCSIWLHWVILMVCLICGTVLVEYLTILQLTSCNLLVLRWDADNTL